MADETRPPATLGIASWLTIGGFCVSLATLIFGGIKFFQEFEMNAKQPFLEKQMEYCFEASDVVATVATNPNGSDTRTKAEGRFWELYWGQLAIVENAAVETEMVCFGHWLNQSAQTDCGDIAPRQRSLRLAKACRNLVSEMWGVSLENLVGKSQDGDAAGNSADQFKKTP
ncbi:hypothetical protein [Jiella mangrovi]|uniref:Uncharacterized protein n=1 Tax=Jiella mangrovi TaxID=2821407 RepID=A0ABS4BD53_9HYPH|nr:hypothetical protein [Jiella mangrovi]MBP0614696.1 hypothetical protein [Jiella mangrovi]